MNHSKRGHNKSIDHLLRENKKMRSPGAIITHPTRNHGKPKTPQPRIDMKPAKKKDNAKTAVNFRDLKAKKNPKGGESVTLNFTKVTAVAGRTQWIE
jgi:hypothetical protein